jgi:hypothetical protein
MAAGPWSFGIDAAVGRVLDVITYSAAASAGVKGTRRQQALGLLAMMLQSTFEKGEQWL